MASDVAFRFACRQCRQVLQVRKSAAGAMCRCPKCGNKMKVPVPAAPSEPAEPPEDQEDEYRLLFEEHQAPALATRQPSGDPSAPVSCGSNTGEAKADRSFFNGFENAFTAEKKGIEKGILGGMLMIGIAVVWFVAGLAAGYIFYYPPILLLIGIYAVLKGLFTGNIAGQRGGRH